MGVGEENTPNNRIARSLIKFDLSSIPANATITSATLSLWTSADLSSNNRVIRVYRLKVPFNETQVTWSRAISGVSWQTAGASGSNDRESTDIGSVIVLNNEALGAEKQIMLTPARIQELVNGTFVNNGFIIVADTEQNDRFDYSTSDTGTATQRPKLVIHYVVNPGVPTSTQTPNPTQTSTSTVTATATKTNTPGPTNTPTHTPTATRTNTPGATSTPTNTQTPTATATPTGTAGPSPTPTRTPTPTATPTGTATPTQTHTPTATPNGSDSIFADGFESGNFSAWSSNKNDGDLSVSAAAALVGSQGMQALIDDNNANYVNDDSPNAEPRYRARFYFDPNSIPMASGDAHMIFKGFVGTSTEVFKVEFRKFGVDYQIQVSIADDGSNFISSSFFTISDAVHFIELDWWAATAVGANNGGLTLWIDGVQKAVLTGIDNDTRRVDQARLGALSAIDTGTRGTYYFDAFESRRLNYIGP